MSTKMPRQKILNQSDTLVADLMRASQAYDNLDQAAQKIQRRQMDQAYKFAQMVRHRQAVVDDCAADGLLALCI